MQNVFFLPIVKAILPPSWCLEPGDLGDLYAYSVPKSGHIKTQGWKIFVSCHFFNAEMVIRNAAICCAEAEMDTPFKFIQSRLKLATTLGKSYPRAEGAKAIVIYPQNTDACHKTMLALEAALDGIEAPPVLSGRRFKNAPVFYRYGSNSDLTDSDLTEDKQPYLRHPETKELVLDRICPWYEVPLWITDPFQPDLDVDADADAPDTEVVLKGRYVIKEAIDFSNRGGIYLAADKTTDTDDLCCLKEARTWMVPQPFTGEDAVSRLAREAETLKHTNPACVAPKFIDYFMEGDHAFLVREFIDGETLGERKSREPFSAIELTSIGHALEKILELKEILGNRRLDLSPQNVIFDGSTIKMIDFETDTDSGSGLAGEYVFGTQGFIPPPGVCPWRWGIQALLDFCTNNEKRASNLNAVV